MKFDISYKGERLSLSLSGDDLSASQLKGLLSSISDAERPVTEADVRAKVVRQIKSELLDGEMIDENISPGLWEVPSDLLRHPTASSFVQMESDLNAGMVFEKTSFPLIARIAEDGNQQLALDRDVLKSSLNRLALQEKLPATSAVLARIKGNFSKGLSSEVEDFLKSYVGSERFHLVVDEKKAYGSRAALELVLFGDFSFE